jgi:putative transposase
MILGVLAISCVRFRGQAMGVESSGKKHVQGLWQGATENTTMVKELLEDLVARGLNTEQRHLFVIDEAKALRAGE